MASSRKRAQAPDGVVRGYRLCKTHYSTTVLEGEGGRVAAGRWHNRGQRIVYCASSEALAVLELRVHLGRFLPQDDYTMHAVEIPLDEVETLSSDALTKRWNAVPATAATRAIGDTWLESLRSLALRVPSIHSSSDTNILLNPAHPDRKQIRVVSRAPYTFDRRLFHDTR
jgi:RES domain-containing protein